MAGFHYCEASPNRFNVINRQKFFLKLLQDKILNILGHLSEQIQHNKDLVYDAQEIWEALSRKGFSDDEIEGALEHIEATSLEGPGPFWSEHIPIYRTYCAEEVVKVTSRARGFLWQLKSSGVIDHAMEDEILQKALNLEDRAGLKEIKTVAALTIFGYEHRAQGCSIESPSRLLS